MLLSKMSVGKFLFMISLGIYMALAAPIAQAATWLESFIGYNDVTGVSNNDESFSTKQLADGNFLVMSVTNSVGQGHDPLAGNYFDNILLQKIDGEGKPVWQYSLGYAGKQNDYAREFKETSDGGIILVGGTDASGNNDILVSKLDSSANIVWQKVIGGAKEDIGYSIIETYDHNFVLVGFTETGAFGSADAVMIKLDSNGNVLWQQEFGDVNYDVLKSVRETADHGYVASGHTTSYGSGNGDAWIIRVGEDGKYDITANTWSRVIGGTDVDTLDKIITTTDGNYLAVGYTASPNPSPYKGLAVKINPTGGIIWQKMYGGGVNESFNDVLEDTGSEYVVGGLTVSYGAGSMDGWFLRLDANGAILAQKALGDANGEHINAISPTNDNGFVLSGGISTPLTGKSDIWIGKVDDSGDLDDPDCITSTVTSAIDTNAGLVAILTVKNEGDPGLTVNNASLTRVSVTLNYLQTSSYCTSYLEITGAASTMAGANNELTITAYDTAGSVRTNYNGPKTITFSGLSNNGIKFPAVEGTIIGTPQTINFTAGVSDPLVATLTPQIVESATLSLTDGKYNCNPIAGEPSHCLALNVTGYLKTWSKLFDSSGHDAANAVAVAADGNFIVGGYIPSNLSVMKLDQDGTVIWETSYGDSFSVTLNSLKVASDGSIFVGGATDASGTNDFLAMKLDGNGNILWQKSFDLGGPSEVVSKMHILADGGLMLIGQASIDPLLAPVSEAWLVRLDASGNIVWENRYGGADQEMVNALYENPDGSFIVAGWTYSFAPAPNNEYVGWIFKIDSAGALIWSNTYDILVNDPIKGPGTSASSIFNSITGSTALGKYILAGRNLVANAGAYEEALLMQIDANGNLDWIFNYGDSTSFPDEFFTVMNGGSSYYLAGNTEGLGIGDNDGFYLQIDAGPGPALGTVNLAKAIGDNINNLFYDMKSTLDGGMIFAGRSRHPIPPGLKQSDIWVVKTDASGNIFDPSCLTVNDVTAAVVRTIPGNKVNDVTAVTKVNSTASTAGSASLVASGSSLGQLSYCTSYFVITGLPAMSAGTTNELTVTAYDLQGNVVSGYEGSKYLTFSGLSPIGIYNPVVEAVTFGNPVLVNFTAGSSDLSASTLVAYKEETSTVHATDQTVTSQPHGGTPNGGLPLIVNVAPLDHYEITNTTPQTTAVGWTEIVTSNDLYGNLVKMAGSFTAKSNGHAYFFDSPGFTSQNNVYNLVGGIASIFVYDLNAEIIKLSATDAAAKTGLSGNIVVSGSAAPVGGGGAGPSLPVAGGASSGGFAPVNLPPAMQFLTTPEQEDTTPPSLSCLSQTPPLHEFNDVSNHQAADIIKLLAQTKNQTFVISGYEGSDGSYSFQPDRNINRAEFLKMALVANCLGIEEFSGQSAQIQPYGDVPLNSDNWYKNYVYSATKKGIVSGYPDGNFYPEKSISRAEAIKILVNIQKLKKQGYQAKSYFHDVVPADWFFEYVSAGRENNLILGSKGRDGLDYFRPSDPITRAETATILVRIYDLRKYISLK